MRSFDLNNSRNPFQQFGDDAFSDPLEYDDFSFPFPKDVDLKHKDVSLSYPWYPLDDFGPATNDTIPGFPDGALSNCTEEIEFLKDMNNFYSPSQIIVPAIYCIICLVGLIGNGLVMFVIFGSKEMTKTVANIYIWNLAVADSLFLVTLPFSSSQRILLYWPFGTGMCKIVEAVKYLNLFASIFFLTAMSIDRYIAVVYVVTSSRWRTSRNTYFVCAAIWLVSLVIVIPLLIYTRVNQDLCALVFNERDVVETWNTVVNGGEALNAIEEDYSSWRGDCDRVSYNDYVGVPYENERKGEMSGDYEFQNFLEEFGVTDASGKINEDFKVVCKHAESKTFHVFLIFTFVIGFVIPFLIITACYIMIIVRLLQPSETRTRSKQADRIRRKVTGMVMFLVITFFICWLPFHVWHLILIRGIRANMGVCHNVRDFTFCLGFANSCLNPFLYTFLGHNFQERLRKSIAISLRSFSFTTFTKYTTNTISRGETAPHSRKLDTSHSEHAEVPAKVNQPLCQVKREDSSDAQTKPSDSNSPNEKLIEEKVKLSTPC